MGSGVITSAVDGGECLAPLPGCFTTWERTPSTHWIDGWLDFRADLDLVTNRKIPSLTGNRTPVA